MTDLPEKLVELWNETLAEPVDPFLALLEKLDGVPPLSTETGRGDGASAKPTRGG